MVLDAVEHGFVLLERCLVLLLTKGYLRLHGEHEFAVRLQAFTILLPTDLVWLDQSPGTATNCAVTESPVVVVCGSAHGLG